MELKIDVNYVQNLIKDLNIDYFSFVVESKLYYFNILNHVYVIDENKNILYDLEFDQIIKESIENRIIFDNKNNKSNKSKDNIIYFNYGYLYYFIDLENNKIIKTYCNSFDYYDKYFIIEYTTNNNDIRYEIIKDYEKINLEYEIKELNFIDNHIKAIDKENNIVYLDENLEVDRNYIDRRKYDLALFINYDNKLQILYSEKIKYTTDINFKDVEFNFDFSFVDKIFIFYNKNLQCYILYNIETNKFIKTKITLYNILRRLEIDDNIFYVNFDNILSLVLDDDLNILIEGKKISWKNGKCIMDDIEYKIEDFIERSTMFKNMNTILNN